MTSIFTRFIIMYSGTSCSLGQESWLGLLKRFQEIIFSAPFKLADVEGLSPPPPPPPPPPCLEPSFTFISPRSIKRV